MISLENFKRTARNTGHHQKNQDKRYTLLQTKNALKSDYYTLNLGE